MSEISKPTFLPQAFASLFRSFWALLILISLLRIITLLASPAELGPDEAQYWFWSRSFDFGYFSKPPLIAWLIAMMTAIFGNEEWAVRLIAPLLHAGTASFIFLTARKLFDKVTAFWSGLFWLLTPGTALSSFVIATDAPLLFFWSGALYFFFRQTTDKLQGYTRLLNASLIGLFTGFAFLSKYAALYLFLGFGLVLLFNSQIRKQFLFTPLIIMVIVAGAVIAPNILWNAANDFQTVSHTAANANWQDSLFHVDKFFAFFFAQFGVFGPICFASLLWFSFPLLRNIRTSLRKQATEVSLLIFSFLPLIVVSLQAFISRAHANWAASAYPAATILVVYWLLNSKHRVLIKANVGIHAIVAILFFVAITNFSLIDRFGLSSATKEIRGWEAHAQDIAAQASGFDAIMIDDRSLTSTSLYYLRDQSPTIVALDPNANRDTHFEVSMHFDPSIQERVLFVTSRNDDAHIEYRFDHISPLSQTVVAIGDQQRSYHIFDVSGYNPPNRKIDR